MPDRRLRIKIHLVTGQGKGKVECRFVGGPQGDETIVLAAMYCRDVVCLLDNVWYAETPDGGATIMRGRRSKDAPWTIFYRQVYEKEPRAPGKPVTYRFVKTDEVHRCARLLEKLGRRCGHEATPGSPFCRAHDPTKKPQSRRARLANGSLLHKRKGDPT